MSRISLAFGQRLLPAASGEQSLASGFAVVGARHLLCVADATGAPGPTALARAAVDAAMLRLRGPDDPAGPAWTMPVDQPDRGRAPPTPPVRTPRRIALPRGPDLVDIVAAMDEAAGAVRRAALGLAPGAEFAFDLAIVAVDTQRGVAEIGLAGRLAIFHAAWDAPIDARAAQVTLSASEGAESQPRTGSVRLAPHATLIVASHAASLHVMPALRGARGRQDPNILARQLTDAARRAGEAGAVFVGVLDRPDDGPREGPHPAFVRMQREAAVTVDGDGHVLGARFRPRGAAARRLRPERGWNTSGALAGLVAVCGLGVAGWHLVHGDASEVVGKLGLGNLTRETAIPTLPDLPPQGPPPTPTPPPPLPDPVLDAALDASSAQLAAERLRDWITAQPAADREAAFTRLDALFSERLRAKTLPRAALDSLPLLAADTSLPRTARWAARVLGRTQRGSDPR